MQIEEALSKSRMWIDQLVGKELQYITGRNTSVINNVDWDDEGKIFVSRGEGQITIRFERIAAVISKLIKGHPVHVDTILRSGSNDRSVIETIIANFPPVGFMRPSQGRNKSKNKVIQWLCEDVHSVGVIQDISPDEFAALSLSAAHIKNAQLLSKPFLLLAGISGTGKTRFVREQAKTSKQFTETYCLTSVRPDWHEPSDLLGYISRLNGAAEYITTDVLQFIAKAWRAIADSGLTVEVQESDDQGERLVVAGERDALDKVLPYWLCLDEMNLAPVEQYFADYLSVLETREWRWTGDSFTYSCDALLKPATIKEVADKEKLREALGFEGSQYDELWADICQYGLSIPFNLLVAGTVNMDETTHGFSRKVIDRALSFDFGAFFPNNYNDFFTPTSCNKRLSYPIWSNASKADLADTFDADGTKTVAFLSAVNAVLKNTPFELAFRALNELLLAVASSQPHDELTLKAVWDDFMMCKVLPRIEGDTDKLTTSDGKALLVELDTVLTAQLAPIWQAEQGDRNQRPDLYREKIVADDATDEEKVLRIPCRSKAKLKWMSERLVSATFTSFWP
ncbi:McrB family protein [Vibrio cholerae]|uniref:McrB family protein n=1 Tax=Vibrio cholerae TaxID=666 RepID=UPI00208CB220|nr:restriction endonuclease [Vibrio cholerae]MCO7071298.1 restriction endonuclease [Vibrio cholerae]GHZ48630.1 5-methylcytosine-specific restriction related enzyme [Vibrio cholerae]